MRVATMGAAKNRRRLKHQHLDRKRNLCLPIHEVLLKSPHQAAPRTKSSAGLRTILTKMKVEHRSHVLQDQLNLNLKVITKVNKILSVSVGRLHWLQQGQNRLVRQSNVAGSSKKTIIRKRIFLLKSAGSLNLWWLWWRVKILSRSPLPHKITSLINKNDVIIVHQSTQPDKEDLCLKPHNCNNRRKCSNRHRQCPLRRLSTIFQHPLSSQNHTEQAPQERSLHHWKKNKVNGVVGWQADNNKFKNHRIRGKFLLPTCRKSSSISKWWCRATRQNQGISSWTKLYRLHIFHKLVNLHFWALRAFKAKEDQFPKIRKWWTKRNK